MNAQDAVTEEYPVLTVEAHTPTFHGESEAVAIPTELDKIVGRQPTRPASTVLARPTRRMMGPRSKETG